MQPLTACFTLPTHVQPDNYIGSQRLFADVRSDKGVTMNAGVDRGGYAPGDDAVVTFAIQARAV